MANTPEVDNWLAATNGLVVAAIGLSSGRTIDADTASMMRQVQNASAVLLTSLQRLPPEAPPPPPPTPPVEETEEH